MFNNFAIQISIQIDQKTINKRRFQTLKSFTHIANKIILTISLVSFRLTSCCSHEVSHPLPLRQLLWKALLSIAESQACCYHRCHIHSSKYSPLSLNVIQIKPFTQFHYAEMEVLCLRICCSNKSRIRSCDGTVIS